MLTPIRSGVRRLFRIALGRSRDAHRDADDESWPRISKSAPNCWPRAACPSIPPAPRLCDDSDGLLSKCARFFARMPSAGLDASD